MSAELQAAREALENVQLAARMLIEARNLLTKAGAEKTAARVRHAISSAKGARRNAEQRIGREARKAGR